MIRTRTVRSLAALSSIALAAACSSGGSDGGGVTNPPAGATVHLGSASFSPASITITHGTTVTWTNDTGTAHTITPDAGQAPSWSSHDIAGQGATFQFSFATAGTYAYHCNLHAGMTGVVHVN